MTKHRPFFARLVLGLLLSWLGGAMGAFAQQPASEVFTLDGVRVRLTEVTPQVDVYFTAMRLNRALREWDVEVAISNRTSQAISGPVVVVLDSFQGTSGGLRVDGSLGGTGGKAFYDFTSGLPAGQLAAGSLGPARTLGLGVGTGSPTLVTRVFAKGPLSSSPAGITRTLDDAGQPLPGVTVTTRDQGSDKQQISDPVSAVVSLTGTPATEWIRFSRDGFLSSWRFRPFASSGLSVVPHPRLTPRAAQGVEVNPLGGLSLSNASGSIVILPGESAFAGSATLYLTPLKSQNLPAFLPQGWSPMQAFWWDATAAPQRPVSAQILPWGEIKPSDAAALARWSDASLSWEVVQTAVGNGTNSLAVTLPGLGVYALVVADSGSTAPPNPVAGASLPSSASVSPQATGLSATGVVDPASSPASRTPALVTAEANVTLRHADQPIASGYLLRGEVSETYQLKDGSFRISPAYEEFMVSYQRPGDLDPQTVQARFPMRPLLLFGSDDLALATVKVDVLAPGPFEGQVLDSAGGLLSAADVRLMVGADQLSAPTAFRLRPMSADFVTHLLSDPMLPVAGFDLAYDGTRLSGSFGLRVESPPTNAWFVLARVLNSEGLFGLEPIQRLRSDLTGRLQSVEPADAAHLPGVARSGQYVLIQVPESQLLVAGTLRNKSGQPLASAPVRLSGLPWVSVSKADGGYQLVGPAGTRELSSVDPVTLDVGSSTVVIAPGTGGSADLAVAPHGPRVAQVTPADAATKVPKVLSVVVQFSEPINPASLGVDGITLIQDRSGDVVPATLTINLKNTVVTLNPNTSLDAGTTYRIHLAPTLADPGGLPLEGTNEFRFTTLLDSRLDPAAQLIIYQPGATNVPRAILADIPAYVPGLDSAAIVAHGTAGAADPGVPVILVNESTGETSTVLSKPDGSFSSLISGSEDDFVSATFVNLNGTRTYVPVSRQEFDNGFVGLYRKGGILEAQSDGGPVQVLIEPEAVLTKTKFRIKTLTAAQLAAETGGAQPETAALLGTALVLEGDGQGIQGNVKVKFSVNLLSAGYPTNSDPADAAIALVRVTDDQDVKAFQVLDQLKFTTTPPAAAPRLAGTVGGDQIFFGTVDSVIGLVPGAGIANNVFRYVLMPILMGGKPIVVKGVTATSLEVDKLINPFSDAAQVAPGAAGKVLGAASGLIDSVNSKTEMIVDLALGRPLAGAFVALANVDTPAFPGRLRQGMVYATSDRDGTFLMVAPTTPLLQISLKDFYVVMATHPRFNDREKQDLHALTDASTLAGVVFKNFVFRDPLPFGSPPSVNVAHAPLYPAPAEQVEMQVNASQGYLGNPTINVFVDSVLGLDAKAPPPVSYVRIFNIAITNLSGNRTRWIGQIQASNSVRKAIFRVSVISGNGTVHPTLLTAIDFTGEPPRSDDPIQVSDPTSKQGPTVVAVTPADGGYIADGGEINIRFSEPIARSVESDVSGILLNGPVGARAPVVRLDASQTTLTLQYAGLLPDSEYVLSLSAPSIRDLSGNPLDQRPSTTAPDSFTYTFHTAPVRQVKLPGVADGRGAAIHGTRLYVLDAGVENLLKTFDISKPNQPTLLSSVRVAGQPRDLVVLPDYAFKPSLHAPAQTNDLVAVVGGNLDTIVDALDSVIVSGMYLRVFDMANPASPVELVAATVTKRVGAVVPKIRWFPPNLIYQEFGPDLHQLVFVNLQEMLVGFRTPRAELDLIPAGKEGKDADENGDYVGPKDVIPIPPRLVAEFYGKKQSLILTGTTQKVLDFSVAGGTVGVTLTRGLKVTSGGTVTSTLVYPQYRTLSFNGQDVNPVSGSQSFAESAYPSRVALFEALPIEINKRLTTPTVAIVSVAPDQQGRQALVIIDITEPETPKVINTIYLPDSAVGGSLESVSQRDDGRLEVTTSSHVLVLDTTRLGNPNPPDGQLHSAVVDFIPGAGARPKSVATSGYGVRATADGGKNQIVQTAPVLAFVSFPGSTQLVDPRYLPRTDAAVGGLFQRMSPATDGLIPARVRAALGQNSQLFPADSTVHYHVLAFAPGGATEKIQLGLEGLSRAGLPLPNKGAGFAAVRSVSSKTLDALGIKLRETCDASINSLTAYRLSDDPTSAYYNYYLSKPFALVYERLSIPEVNQYRLEADREILWSTAFLQAFIDPVENANSAIGDFAARIDTDRKMIRPIASATVPALDLSYAPGDNPPPLGGDERLDGTLGTVVAHSGEFRTEAIDLTLPSPRMPISIERAIGGQDTYDGPFGLGWDFNYNQRITQLQPQMFPAGVKMPLIPRDTEEDSVIAGTKDVIFLSGEGRVVLFQWISDTMPPEYASDPLVKDLKYEQLATDFFLPEPGSFDLLVKFQDGQYERLTPDGLRFRYGANGRLEKITDRFPKNQHVLEYDRSGWLVRIDDRSVSADRFVEFGYYRRGSDPDFNSGLDVQTDNRFVEGKICRLRDYAGRDVLFFYSDEGLLIRREGIAVDGENGGYAGRTKTHYFYKECRITGTGVGDAGTPLFSAATDKTPTGGPVAKAGDGIAGPAKVDVAVDNTAAKLANQKTSVTQADGRKTEHVTDKYGYVTSTTVSGAKGPSSTTQIVNNKHGQVMKIVPPEGGTSVPVYDTNNLVFRSRGNLISLSVDPGPRGGPSYTQVFRFDPRYNLPSGPQQDANGFIITQVLRADGREVASVQHGAAGSETFAFDDNGQQLHHTDIDGIETSLGYDASTGFLTLSKQGSNPTSFGYDSSIAGRLGQPTLVSPPEGDPIVNRYNAELQTVQVTRGEQSQATAYDELGRPSAVSEAVGDGKTRVTRTEWDAKGFLVKSRIEGIEVDGADGAIEVKYKPDELSRVKTITYINGTTETYDFDNHGNRIQMTRGEYVEEYGYDLHNNLTSQKEGGDLVKTIVYDGNDRPKTIVRKLGDREETEELDYFPGGQLKSRTVRDSLFGLVEQQTVERIDELGRPLSVVQNGVVISPTQSFTYKPGEATTQGPRSVTRRTWDAAGHTLETSDPTSTVTVHSDGTGKTKQIDRKEIGATYSDFFDYNNLEQLKASHDLLGSHGTVVPRADGQVTTVINARNNALSMDHSVLGELLRKKRADGMEFRFRHDAQRQVRYTGDAGFGFKFAYDGQFRLIEKSQRDGAVTRFTKFDSREMPVNLSLPGGTATMGYDLQRRPIQSSVVFQSTTFTTGTTHDGAGRPRRVEYEQTGSAKNLASYDYDPSGVLTVSRFQEDGTDFRVETGYYEDGARKTCRYPSGVTITEERDATGRLVGISDAGGNILHVSSWQGNAQPKTLELGTAIRASMEYDARGRLTAARYTRAADGAVLAHQRVQLDAVGNVELRQSLHRGGRADNFSYDAGERLSRAQMAGIPATNGPGVNRVLYERSYDYEGSGLDYLVAASSPSPLAGAPAFATAWNDPDAFLLPGKVNGFARGAADPMGRVAHAQLQVRAGGGAEPSPVAADLVHNGMGYLVSIQRADQTLVENRYQPGGLRYSRKTSQGGQVVDFRHYVYDEHQRLIEEYDRTGQNPLILARYYYAEGDAPVAADLRLDTGTPLQRYYYLRDDMMSVIAVADAGGTVVERVWYDAFGQPVIQGRDAAAPAVKRVLASGTGGLLIELSEPVGAVLSDPGPGTGIVRFDPDLTLTIVANGTGGRSEVQSTLAGFAPSTVILFTPTQALSGPITLAVDGSRLADEWGNKLGSRSVNFTPSGQASGTVYYAASPVPSTSTVIARSSIGSPFLFHGQYFDYDTGLIYLRARYYDPFSGMFLEPDPLGYEDSVNLYAGMANNPTSKRDPSGLQSMGLGVPLGATFDPQSMALKRYSRMDRIVELRTKRNMGPSLLNRRLDPANEARRAQATRKIWQSARPMHPGEERALSDKVSFESIMKASREVGTPDNLRTAIMLKRGMLVEQGKMSRSAGGYARFRLRDLNPYKAKPGGVNPHGARRFVVLYSGSGSPRDAAALATHEVEHVLQRFHAPTYDRAGGELTSQSYSLLHEAGAYAAQARARGLSGPMTTDAHWVDQLNNGFGGYKDRGIQEIGRGFWPSPSFNMRKGFRDFDDLATGVK